MTETETINILEQNSFQVSFTQIMIAIGLSFGFLLVIFMIIIAMDKPNDVLVDESTSLADRDVEMLFEDSGLYTNTEISSIPLSDILGGGPGKDGIPAISEPMFISQQEVSGEVPLDTRGLFVQVGDDKRFYPYNILVWHEIVNDEIGGIPLAITFCPLCGTGITFERKLGDGEVVEFGVSGKLHESNLLMFDRKIESLWSQITGEAVVGDLTGQKLKIYPSQLLTLSELKEIHPDAMVLSTETGHSRDYINNPYGNYDDQDDVFYFPTSFDDNRLPAKEVMYVVNYKNKSIAFKFEDLRENNATVEIEEEVLIGKFENGEVKVVVEGEDKQLPGFFAMWFSWSIFHQQDGVLWVNE